MNSGIRISQAIMSGRRAPVKSATVRAKTAWLSPTQANSKPDDPGDQQDFTGPNVRHGPCPLHRAPAPGRGRRRRLLRPRPVEQLLERRVGTFQLALPAPATQAQIDAAKIDQGAQADQRQHQENRGAQGVAAQAPGPARPAWRNCRLRWRPGRRSARCLIQAPAGLAHQRNGSAQRAVASKPVRRAGVIVL